MADIRAHPGDDLLSGYEAGTLSPGEYLAVATHVELCAACTSRVFDAAFDGQDPALLAAPQVNAGQIDALLATALSRLDLVAPLATRRFVKSLSLPHAIAAERIGRRR